MKYILRSTEEMRKESTKQSKESQEKLEKPTKTEFSVPKNECAYYFDAREMMVHKVQENLLVAQGYSEVRSMIVPFMISSRKDILHYLKAAAYAEEIPIDSAIFCIIHIPEYNIDSSFQTLAFYQDGLILKSNESSNSITNRIFSKLGLKYEHMRSLISILEGQACHCQPYIYGNVCFMPVNGPSKQAVSWINLSHLVSYGKIPNEREKVKLLFDNRHTFDMPIRYNTFEKNLRYAVESYSKQHHYYFKISNLMGYEVVKKQDLNPNSILNQRVIKYEWNKQELPLNDWMKKFQFFSLRKLLKEPIFKENPLVDEMKESLNQNYFFKEKEKKSQ